MLGQLRLRPFVLFGGRSEILIIGVTRVGPLLSHASDFLI